MTSSASEKVCHSERSEESAFFFRRGRALALPASPKKKRALAPEVRRAFLVLFLVLSLVALPLFAADQSARFNSLGHRMICGCGCNQILLECNHVGCPLSDAMRAELSAALARGDADDLILQAFVQKYGPTILAAPPATGFNRVAWIMPFAVLLLAIGTASIVIKNWKQPQTAEAAPSLPSALRDEIRRETDL